MKKVFISKNYRDKFTASSKAKLDAERIAVKGGYKNIGLPAKSIQNQTIGRAYTFISNLLGFFRMPKDGEVFIQYPVNFCEQQVRRAKKRNNKITVLIHDLNSLRALDLTSLEPIKQADRVIAHTPAMKRWLIDNHIIHNVEVLQIFDYLDNKSVRIPNSQDYRIAFAGNLGKSEFLNKLEGTDNISYRLFGVGSEQLKFNKGVTFEGCFPPDELAVHLDAHFGLVWDGNSLQECDGVNGEYLKFISPHKLSMYLSAGLPVIVWSKSAMADFVSKQGVGIVVESLKEIPSILEKMDSKQYEEMRKRASHIGSKILNGEYLLSALKGK